MVKSSDVTSDWRLISCPRSSRDDYRHTRLPSSVESKSRPGFRFSLPLTASSSALFESEPNGLSLQVVQRLHDLKAIEKTLEQRDVWKQLPNVQSLMEAYRSKKLVWEEGSVTYWSRGSQICKPKQFKWKDFEEVNRKFDGYKGFWVEGVSESLHMRVGTRINLV